MKKIHKYQFDNQLDQYSADHQKIHSDLITDAFEKGRLQGLNESEKKFEAIQQTTLEAISDSLQNAASLMNSEILRIENEAIFMTNELVKLYTATLLSKQPNLEISTIVKKATQAIGNTPILSISVGASLTDEVKTLIEKAFEDAGYSGMMSISEKSSLRQGDIEIEWPSGGFRYSRHDLNEIIDQIIQSHSK